MKKIVSIASFCFSIILLPCCSKDTGSNGTKLARIKLADQVESEFSYDAGGRMIYYVSYGMSNVKRSEQINTYDNNGKLIRQTIAMNLSSTLTGGTLTPYGYTEYTYGADGKLTESRTYNTINSVTRQVSKSIPAYDAQGHTIAVTLYDSATNSAYSKRTYAYNAQGNVSVEEFFQYSLGQGPYTHTEYEYDDKKNPFQGQWVLPFGANNNNITKSNTTSYYSNTGIYIPAGVTGSTVSVFKRYNNSGYPAIVNEYGNDRVYEYQ